MPDDDTREFTDAEMDELRDVILVSAEDARLLAAWQSGPGARPTAADSERWLIATREHRFSRRHRLAGDDHA